MDGGVLNFRAGFMQLFWDFKAGVDLLFLFKAVSFHSGFSFGSLFSPFFGYIRLGTYVLKLGRNKKERGASPMPQGDGHVAVAPPLTRLLDWWMGGWVSRYLGFGWNMHCTTRRGGGGGDRGAEVNRLLLVFPFCLKSGKREHKQPVSVSHRFSLFLFFFLFFFSLIPMSFRAGGDISKNECKSTLRFT